MNALTVKQYLRDNNQSLYGLERSSPVNLYILFYHNLMHQAFFDIKASTTTETRLNELALMYFGVSRLIIYLGYEFRPTSNPSKKLDYFSNIYEIERSLSAILEYQNNWLLGVWDYPTALVVPKLEHILSSLYIIVRLSDATIEEVLYRSLEIFGKQWELPKSKDEINLYVRRLDDIRKKLLKEAEDARAKLPGCNFIQSMPQLKPKKIYTIATQLGGIIPGTPKKQLRRRLKKENQNVRNGVRNNLS